MDTHVRRLAERLGFSAEKDPDKIERDLMRLIPRKRWFDFTYVIIDHGRAICVARTAPMRRVPGERPLSVEPGVTAAIRRRPVVERAPAPALASSRRSSSSSPPHTPAS